jgi:hypothetical protein
MLKIHLEPGQEPEGDEWFLIQLDETGGRVEFNGRKRTQFVTDALWERWERDGSAIAQSLGLDRLYYRRQATDGPRATNNL